MGEDRNDDEVVLHEEPTHDPKLDRIWTIPNVISFARLASLPVFLYLLFHHDGEQRAAAAWLLGALGTTDFADGYIARRFDQVSNLGKLLDPVADRLIFIVGGGAILLDGSVPTWFAVTVLARELVVGGATIVLAAMGARRIDVTWFGKAGTFMLLVAFPLFLANASALRWWIGFAWLAGIPGLALSIYAAVLYVPIARRALEESRVSPTTAG